MVKIGFFDKINDCCCISTNSLSELHVELHVKLPVTVVEEKFLDESEYHNFKDDPVERRQLTSEATAAPLHHDERQIHERNTDNRLVDDHHQDGLP